MATIFFRLKKHSVLIGDYPKQFKVEKDKHPESSKYAVSDPRYSPVRAMSNVTVVRGRVQEIDTAWSAYQYIKHQNSWEYRGALKGFLAQEVLPFGRDDLKEIVAVSGTYGEFHGNKALDQYKAARDNRTPEDALFDAFYGKHQLEYARDARSTMELADMRFSGYAWEELEGMTRMEFFRRVIERKGFVIPNFPKSTRAQRKLYHKRGIVGDDIQIERFLEHINLYGVAKAAAERGPL